MHRSRSLVLAFLFAAVVALPAVASAAPAAEPRLAWHGWDEGLAAAKSSRKHVLVDVYTDWCGWCRRMDRDVYARPDVRAYLDEHYVIIKLDAESNAPASYRGRKHTQQSIAAEFGVTGYPTTLFLKSGGEHLVKAPGYLPPERFLQILRYVAEGHFEDGVSFDAFTKSAN